MGEVIRWHDHDRAAKCWATEAKYRRLVANGLAPRIDPEMPCDVNPFDGDYFAPEQDRLHREPMDRGCLLAKRSLVREDR